ncbi:MAG: gamma-glutamyltransferase family protein [Anaerolineales bacterium]
MPGVVAGLCKMLEEQGSLPLPKILSPAIRIARQGAVLSKPQAYITHLLKPILLDTPEITALYAPEGQFVTAGDRLRFPELANTLEALGKEGVGLFYTGVVAQTILADQRAHGGLVTGRDLAAYRVRRTTPLSIHYRGYTILLPPPSSSGGPLIAFSLRLLGAIPLENVAHNGFDHLRTLAEVMRVTNVARARWEEVKHDDDGVQVFLGDEHVRQCGQKLQKAIDGHPQEPEPNLPKDPPNTTHISVADGNGMLVGITTSAGENAGFVVGNTGIMLNNMLGEIDLHPNGFHKTPPGQRFATMMSPAIVLKGSQPVLVVGSGGSSRLRTAILQVISNVLDFKLPLKEAVEAPRLHFEANVAQLEGGIDPGVADQLEDDLDRSSAGDTVNRWGKRTMFFGGTHTVARQGNTWAAAGDPRRGGATEIVD